MHKKYLFYSPLNELETAVDQLPPIGQLTDFW